MAHATPEALLLGVEGKVWEWVVASAELDAVRLQFLISSATRRSDGVHLRVLGNDPPSGAVPAAPDSGGLLSPLPLPAPHGGSGMNRIRALTQMVRADFLERVRRYSFLLTLGFSVYLGYAVYAGQITLQLDTYRGVSNSAWLGSVIGLVGSVWLTLVGFYIVKNAIQRDRETRVGQILATTPMSKSFYTLAKMLSNFAVLAAMVLVLALAALAIQFTPGTDPRIEPFALFAPVLILGLSAVAVTAALAVLFESLPVLRGGVGNVFYFFLWTALVATSAASLGKNDSSLDARSFTDYTGIGSVLSQMQTQVRAIDPTYNNNATFNAGGQNATTRTFPWAGLNWTQALLLSRAMLFALAALIAMLAASSSTASIQRAAAGRR